MIVSLNAEVPERLITSIEGKPMGGICAQGAPRR
jgi:hypothetical protein